jgi:putative transposase
VAQRGGRLPSFEDLEVIRADAGLSVTRMCQLLGMPRAAWYRWRAKHAEQWAAWATARSGGC